MERRGTITRLMGGRRREKFNIRKEGGPCWNLQRERSEKVEESPFHRSWERPVFKISSGAPERPFFSGTSSAKMLPLWINIAETHSGVRTLLLRPSSRTCSSGAGLCAMKRPELFIKNEIFIIKRSFRICSPFGRIVPRKNGQFWAIYGVARRLVMSTL